MIVAIPGLWLVPNHIIIDETTIGRPAFGAITAILALILVGAVLAILFLRQVIAIVDSVKIGSPFVPEVIANISTRVLGPNNAFTSPLSTR